MARQTTAKRNTFGAGEILDAALARAERDGWDAVRLADVAADLAIPLADIRACYRDKDALADALFARGLEAMLAPAERSIAEMPAKERLRFFLLRWFDALSPHRRVAAEMLGAKMWPFHPHHWGPMVFDLSRLIHWLRDAAGLGAAGRRRQVEEVGLTALFLATLAVWCRDDSDGQARTHAFLDAHLDRADRGMARMFRRTDAVEEDRGDGEEAA